MFVDSGTGSIQDIKVPSGTMNGLSWLDARSLVLNYPAQLGAPNQLIRQPYPAGPLSRLTNDPNDYVGISLSGDRRRLVTGRRDARMDLWVGDGGATTGADVVQRVPSPMGVDRVAWAGDRLLYSGIVGGKPAILKVTPAKTLQRTSSSKPSRLRRPAMAARSCSCSSTDNTLDLWTADANGRRKTRLVPSVTANNLAVTRDDRYVLFTSLAGGTVSIWMVSIEGGSPTKLTDGFNAAVSPDGGSIAFIAQAPGAVPTFLVCTLPGCSSPRTIGTAQLSIRLSAWTPGRSRRRLREGRESLGAAAQRWRSASAHPLHRRPPDPILCVVARRAATGHHAIDCHQRHRAVRGLELEARTAGTCLAPAQSQPHADRESSQESVRMPTSPRGASHHVVADSKSPEPIRGSRKGPRGDKR